MEQLTRWVLRHRRLVVAIWLIVTIIGIATVNNAVNAMDQKFSVPGREGWVTNSEIAKIYDNTGSDTSPLLQVVTLPQGQSATNFRSQLRGLEDTAAKAIPKARVAGYGSTGSRAFLSTDGRTAFTIIYPPEDPTAPFGGNPDAEKDLRKAMGGAKIGGAPVHLTGFDALSAQSGGGDGPGVLLEALVGGFGALIVLAFVFASFLALVPLLMAIPAIMTSFLVVYGITAVTDVSPIVQFLIALIGLGVAIDYSLIVVVRWREERAHGREGDEAIVRAMSTAGRAVVFSGTTVAIGLLALIVLPLPFLRSMGYGGLVIPLISVLVALTLLPVVLHSWGNKLDWPHRRTDDQASRRWTNWAQGIVKHRWVAAISALVVLALLVVAATNLHPGISDVNTIAKKGDAKDGLAALQDSGIGSGALFPHEILTRTTPPDRVAAAVAKVDGIHGTVAPDSPSWRRDGTALVNAFPIPDGSTKESRDLVHDVRDAAHAQGPDVKVGGQPASNEDFINAVYGNFPLMIALIAFFTFVLLARAFRSLVLPAKAVVLNVISVAAAWGVMVLIWQEGHGSQAIWGIDATGAIDSWIPLIVFAFLFGLSMDYEVFILARMREEYDGTHETDEAVVRGIGRTGRLVTSAALILFLAFLSLSSGPDTSVKVLATGLAAGILLDATLIRALLVPAVVSLFGRWNWVLPPRAAKLLRVEPSRPAVEEAG
ncbi:MAG TPA: MMPL family transporter [Thermoleophilaceae bacterium]|nr:MMPL family transporter [Thermoleophilaceae bacterium]